MFFALILHICLLRLGGEHLIELTRLNGTKFTINAEIIEMVEETPDTVVTTTTGHKFIVKESRQEVANLVKLYRKDAFYAFISQLIEKD